MNTQTIFQVGNSNAITIPTALMKELGLKKGQKVVVDSSPDGEALVVKPAPKDVKKKIGRESDKNFQQWLDLVLKEDAGLLDELAHR